ncbi:hypothetical protein U1Q18_036842 [Sarracenia purpurea var. burkii]
MKHLNVEPKCIPGKSDGNASSERVGDNGVRVVNIREDISINEKHVLDTEGGVNPCEHDILANLCDNVDSNAHMHFNHDWDEAIFENEVDPKQCSDVQAVGNDEIANEDVGKKDEDESDLIKKLQEQVMELQEKVRLHDNEIDKVTQAVR